MPKFWLTLPNFEGTREQIRAAVIGEFLKEAPGTGTKELTTQYEYVADEIPGLAKIVLKRPAWLNKGMDFTVHVSGRSFKEKGANRDAPRHSDVIRDLSEKKAQNPRSYKEIARAISSIYHCENISISNLEKLPKMKGLHPVEAILATKWLFVEQDVTYWNSSGRAMFYSALRSHALC